MLKETAKQRGPGTALLSYFFSSRRRHTRWPRDWSSDVCSSDLIAVHRRYTLGLGVGELDGCAIAHQAEDRESGHRLRKRRLQALVGLRAGRRERSEERRVGKEGMSTGAADAQRNSEAERARHGAPVVFFFKQKTAYEMAT